MQGIRYKDRKKEQTSLTETIALNFGFLFTLQELDDAPEASKYIGSHSSSCRPPEQRIAHKEDIVVGLLGSIVAHTPVQKRPAPGTTLDQETVHEFLLVLCVGRVVAVDGGAEVVVGPPHDAVQFQELLEEGERLV